MTPRLKELIDAFETGDNEKAVPLARLLMKDPDETVQSEAKRVLATCLYLEKKFEEASPLWVSLFEKSDSPDDWLSTVLSLTAAKKFDEAEQFFQSAMVRLNDLARKLTEVGTGAVPGIITGPRLLDYYACKLAEAGAPERALPKIKTLAKIYTSVGITDDHLLLIRGVPPFINFCDVISLAYPPTRQNPIWNEIFNELHSGLDEAGKAALQELRKSFDRSSS
jgi:hypothetical protein